ncbi:hypothetical protein LTR98_010927 [Exophiala xenobiotica]|nr:hypothetical protein LTR98_010927 [Exophiala xenobiotica]
MNQLVAFVQPLNVPFPPLRPAGGDPPPVMPTSTNEVEEEEEEEEDDDDHNADNDVTDVNKAAQQSNPGVDDRGFGPNSTNAAYVPAKANTTRPRVNNTADTDTDTDTDTDRVALQLRETCAPPNDQTEVTIQRLQETTETMTMQLEPPENLPSTVEHISRMTQTSIIARESTEAIAVQIAEIPSVDEEWTTPATQQFGLFIIISSRAAYGEDRAS